ncbi:pyruvate kinase [Oceanicoccus sagamiensis]|uniref:Pyruvate kinase n=1 Tax=Oceanicoccus sagamiensis TaxID=716816 RepID=A0A1X9NHD5_9GAMM|nr:pyruvate kinase [Oceanicoccus sagamiensis]ARN74919.1 pyruvate kinase [Oceanicoccus sagamiensis]
MVRRTKIVATIGPASGSAEMIARLLDKGVNVFRLNFSHGSADGHREQASIIRAVCADKKINAAILGDLQGPKIRIGDLHKESLTLLDGGDITLTIDDSKAKTDNCVSVGYKALPGSVAAGDTLLLDDGLIQLTVSGVEGDDVHCKIKVGGELKSRKGLNRLGGGLSAPAITEKDVADIELAVELKLDFLAVSFPSCADDLIPVKDKLAALNANINIISKIERAEAVASDDTLNALIAASDGVMVARGDLGVEIGDAQLIGVQKKIIRQARRANKPVITATQMMESMIHSPVPTRAEVFDVANAVLDGTDAVMLSAETATGKHPTKVVAAMADACLGAEQHPETRTSRYRIDKMIETTNESIALSAIYAANHLENVRASICLTESGETALIMSRLSSSLPIYGMSRHQQTCQRMALYRGVVPILVDLNDGEDNVYHNAMMTIADTGALQAGDRVIITCGDIRGSGGMTNTLKILEYPG